MKRGFDKDLILDAKDSEIIPLDGFNARAKMIGTVSNCLRLSFYFRKVPSVSPGLLDNFKHHLEFVQ